MAETSKSSDSAPFSPQLSVVMPVYNESAAIFEVLRRVHSSLQKLNLTWEVVIVDDGSSDQSPQRIQQYLDEHPGDREKFIYHQSHVNAGKGSALRVGFKLLRGQLVLIQDGDLEYDPEDYRILLTPFKDPAVHVVYGSRFFKGLPARMKILPLIANLILTSTAKILYQQHLTDEATGYKVFRAELLKQIQFQSKGFEFCPELTSKVLKLGHKIYEVPIKYDPRGILEGKKIRAKDGFIAIWWLLRLRFTDK